MRLPALAALLALLLLSTPALAHHGWGTYDANTVLTIESKIVEATYTFPHGEILLEANGKRWRIVLAPPPRMDNRGLPKEMLTVGRTVKIEGYPSKVHDDEIRAERIIIEGKTIELR